MRIVVLLFKDGHEEYGKSLTELKPFFDADDAALEQGRERPHGGIRTAYHSSIDSK